MWSSLVSEMNSEQQLEPQLVAFNETYFTSLKLLPLQVLTHSRSSSNRDFSSYSTRPLCYLKQQTVWREIFHLQLFAEGSGSHALRLKVMPRSKLGRHFLKTAQRLLPPFTAAGNSSSIANVLCVELSQLLQNALLNRSLCILCTPGHRWWNKRLWLCFSSSTVICIFMSFQKKKKNHVMIYTFIYWCRTFFGGEKNHWKQR